MIPFPDKKYSIIYADPPWSYSDSGCSGAAAAQYATMSINELKQLPVNPAGTALYVTSDGNGELVVAEMVPQVPGQMNMDGTQQEAPKLLKLVQHG